MVAHRLLLFLGLSATIWAGKWDSGFDVDLEGDLPAPTIGPIVSNFYPYFSPGTIPTHRGEGRSKDAKRTHSGRLDYRQAQCNDPTYILACPVTETLPCCPPDYPICCHDPSDKCCATGYFCVGVLTCCPNGTTGCGEGCCPAGTACCGGIHCCDTAAGYQCRSGTCVNPTLSSISTQSIQSVASVSSVAAVALSSQSVQSISSELAGQTREDGSGVDTINTVTVLPSDPRIEYGKPEDWVDTASSSSSGVGSCNNGTRATQKSGNFTFVFSGTAIALFIIPSANGGPFTVQIDGEPASALNSKPATGLTSGGQCIPNQIFTRDNLLERPHQVIVQNGETTVPGTPAGTLEFNSIKYTGRGAFGTNLNPPNDNKVSPAVIGGSVGGVLGAIILVGAGILFWLYRRKKRNAEAATAATTPAPVSPNQQMMYQHQPGVYSPTSQTPSSAQYTAAGVGVAGVGAYGGMAAGQHQQQHSPQPSWNPQQQSYPTSPQQQQYPLGSPQGGWTGQQQPGYTDYNRPTSGTSAAMAPLPMWVERASRPGPSDGASMTTAEHNTSPGGSNAYTAYQPH